MLELLEFETTVHLGTAFVLRAGTFRCSKLASVLRKNDCGALLNYLRLSSRSRLGRLPVRLKPDRRPSIISLGRAIVVLYLITLLTAVISVRTRTESELSQPGVRGAEPQETAPHIAGG